MNKLVFALSATLVLAGCTTTERDVATGAALGVATGTAVSGTPQGAMAGAVIGATTGLLVRNLRNGYCEYRNPRTGQLYRARC